MNGKDESTLKELELSSKKKASKKSKLKFGEKKNLDLLPANWKDKILDMYSQGLFDVHIKNWLRTLDTPIGSSVWARWLVEEDDFREVIQHGHDLCLEWWLDYAKNNMAKRDFNNAAWKSVMHNVFRWTDTNIEMSIDDTRASRTKYDDMDEKNLLKIISDKIDESK